MTSPTRGKTLGQLAFCLLLASNMLLWPDSWSASSSQESQLEQMVDHSPAFLVRTGDGSSGDIPLANYEIRVIIVPELRVVTTARARHTPAHRIRIASFPVLPQAPPALT